MKYLKAISVLSAVLLTGCRQQPGNAAPGGGRPPTQVVIVEATKQTVVERLDLVGSVLADEVVQVKPEIDGRIETINFQEGDSVKAGQLLFQLDASKLTNELAEAEANFKLSESTYERNKELSGDKLISPQELDQSAGNYFASKALLDLRARRLKDSRIIAPFAGIVGARFVSAGQVIDRNMVLTWLVDSDPVKVEINVPERFLSQLELQQTIEIQVSTYPDRNFQGKVFFISPSVDPRTRTALVKALIQNPQTLLKPGMFANLELTLRIRESAVVVPEAALARVLEDDRAQIFIVDSNQTAQMRVVKLGTRMPAKVEIVEGLSAGEQVIVEGVQKVGPGSKVMPAPASEGAIYRSDVSGGPTNQSPAHR